MISVKYSDIPSFLHASNFYKSLDSEDGKNGVIEIPTNAFNWNTNVSSALDLQQLTRTMHFWMLDEIPTSILTHCVEVNQSLRLDSDGEHDESVMPVLRAVFTPNDSAHLNIVCRAIATGRLEIIEFLINHADFHDKVRCHETSAFAAERGDLRTLKLLHEHGACWDCTTTDVAARIGHLECLQYAHNHGCALDTSALTAAAAGGHLSCLQYIISTGMAWHRDVCSAAAEHGHLHILTYAYEHNCPWDDFTTENAAKNGHIECLKYALQHGCDGTEDAFNRASENGHLECLVVLFESELSSDHKAGALAAERGHLDCLKFLLLQGVGWSARTTSSAALCGQIDILRYAFSVGIPYVYTLVSHAAEARHNSLPCLKFLIEEQSLYLNENGSIFGAAFMRADAACVKYLIDIGCPYLRYTFWGFVLSKIENLTVFDSDLAQCVDYAMMHGWKSNALLFETACKHNLVLTRQYLEQQGWTLPEPAAEEEDYLCAGSLFD